MDDLTFSQKVPRMDDLSVDKVTFLKQKPFSQKIPEMIFHKKHLESMFSGWEHPAVGLLGSL